MNSMLYGIVWVRSAALIFKAFQNGHPNWNEEELRFPKVGRFPLIERLLERLLEAPRIILGMAPDLAMCR
jgi:hypothetical protein